MSADPQAFDPYRSPSLPEGPYAGQPPSGRPGVLTAICVMAIVLGTLGLMNSFFGTVGAIAGPKLQAMFQPRPGPGTPPEMQQAMQEFQDEITAIQSKFFVELVIALAFRFIAALLLLIGGIRALGFHESGRKTLLLACALALVFELSHAILQSFISMETLTATNSFVEGMTASIPRGKTPPGFRNLMQTIFRGSIIGGIVVALLILLAKAALYLFGLFYLRKPHIKALFKSATSDFRPLTSDLSAP
jgi:hypothetical protein